MADLLHVGPTDTAHDLADGRLAESVAAGDHALLLTGGAGGADLPHLGLRQFRPPVVRALAAVGVEPGAAALPGGPPAPGVHIGQVALLGIDVEVAGVDAGWVVALMADEQPLGDLAEEMHPGVAVRLVGVPVDDEHAVASNGDAPLELQALPPVLVQDEPRERPERLRSGALGFRPAGDAAEVVGMARGQLRGVVPEGPAAGAADERESRARIARHRQGPFLSVSAPRQLTLRGGHFVVRGGV